MKTSFGKFYPDCVSLPVMDSDFAALVGSIDTDELFPMRGPNLVSLHSAVYRSYGEIRFAPQSNIHDYGGLMWISWRPILIPPQRSNVWIFYRDKSIGWLEKLQGFSSSVEIHDLFVQSHLQWPEPNFDEIGIVLYVCVLESKVPSDSWVVFSSKYFLRTLRSRRLPIAHGMATAQLGGAHGAISLITRQLKSAWKLTLEQPYNLPCQTWSRWCNSPTERRPF